MKNNLKELDVDFIGGQESLTNEEAQLISAFIKKNKKKRNGKSDKPKLEISDAKKLEPVQ